MKPLLGFGNQVARVEEKNAIRDEKAKIKAQAAQERIEAKLRKYRMKTNYRLIKEDTKAQYGLKVQENKIQLIQKEQEKAALYEAKRQLGLLKAPKSKRIGPEFVTGFKRSFRNIAKSIPQQRVQFVSRPSSRPQVPERKNKLRNFFAHKDASEVYGDDFSTHDGEELTFFDSDKRAGDDTGALFGL